MPAIPPITNQGQPEGKGLPYLPVEIWMHILRLHPHPYHAWCTCRQVSRAFRLIVDHVFATDILPITAIDFDLGWAYLNEEDLTDKCLFGLHLTFNRFSDDENKERVVFADQEEKAERDPDWINKHGEMERQFWKDKVNCYIGADKGAIDEGGRFDLPPWTIAVGKNVNDTELPGWEIDYDKREIAFQWRHMFQSYFREEEYIAKQVEERADAILKTQEMSPYWDGCEAGTLSSIQILLKIAKIVTDARNTARKEIRRHRIKKFYKDNHNFDFSDDLFYPDEKSCLRHMEQMEAGFDMGPLGLMSGLVGLDDYEPSDEEDHDESVARGNLAVQPLFSGYIGGAGGEVGSDG